MNRKAQCILAGVATLMISGSSFAQSNPNPRPDQTAVSGRPMTETRMENMNSMNGAVDDQIKQELTKIQQDPSTAADKLFVLNAGCGNTWEINFARAVNEKTTNPQVKQLSQQIMQDHQKANDQLKTVATTLDVNLPSGLPQAKQLELNILASLPADQLDKQYVAMMDAAHAKDTKEYRTVSQMAANATVRDYATQTLPVLMQHHQHVQDAAVALGLPNSGGNEAMPASAHMNGSMGSSNITTQDRTNSPTSPANDASQNTRTGTNGGTGNGPVTGTPDNR